MNTAVKLRFLILCLYSYSIFKIQMALNSIFRKGTTLSIRNLIQSQQVVLAHGGGVSVPHASIDKIGNREVVGYGLNGLPTYQDRIDVPLPAVRFKENTPDIQILREKEKGDWNKLSIEEKKALYRASFCQTLAEVKAPTGEWKAIIGLSLVYVSLALWLFIFTKIFVYPPLPKTFTEEHQQAQLQKMINLRMNPVDGLASKYDYEKGKWKE